MKLLGVLLLLTFVCHVTGKNCIKGGGTKKCTKSENDCDDGLVCMDTKPGNAPSLCGAPQAEGCWCDPSLTSVEACEKGYSCQEQHNGKFECECDSGPPDQCSSSDNDWSLTYHHDKDGIPLSGSIKNLIDLVNQGVQVKVFNPPFGFVSVQRLTVSYETEYNCPDGCVHGQALFYASIFSTSPIRNTYFVFSTTGNTHITEFEANSPINTRRLNSNVGIEMKWYTRNYSRLVTSESQLKRYIQDGASVRVLACHNDFSISYKLDVVELTDPISGWSIHNFLDIFGGTEFDTTEQLELSKWSYGGEVKKASWLFNDHTQTGTEELQGQTLKWAVDPCWIMVYRHNGAGEKISGSKDDLVAAVASGKGLRLKVGQKYYTARTIRQLAGTDEIIAQVYDSINSDVTVGQWKWLDVSSTGLVKTVKFNIGDDQLLSENWENREVTWFAEDKVWTLLTEPSSLADQIENGADVRYRVTTTRGIISYLADYAQKEFVVPTNPPRLFEVFILYNDREIVYNGTDYLNRKSIVNWDTRVFSYHDYKVGDTNRIVYTEVPSNEANIQFFYSQVNV